MQKMFNPIDYCFRLTEDGWYEWDRQEAHKQALRDRNAKARELRKEGYNVRCFSLSGQRVKRGGIGTGIPEWDFWVNVYGLNAD